MTKKQRTVFVVKRQFFNVRANGDHTPVKVGTQLTHAQFEALTPQKQQKCVEVPAGLDNLLTQIRKG